MEKTHEGLNNNTDEEEIQRKSEIINGTVSISEKGDDNSSRRMKNTNVDAYKKVWHQANHVALI